MNYYHFTKSLNRVIKNSEHALIKGDVNSALKLIHNFVEKIITNPLYSGHIFASRHLDQICLRIGRQHIAKSKFFQGSYNSHLKNLHQAAYVVSRLQSSGGHSKLVIDFINSQPDKEHLVLITGVGGESDIDYFEKIFITQKNVRMLQCPYFSYVSRLSWLQENLMRSNPAQVHLLNAHQDSPAVAALTPDLNLNVTFYHHGDHHLCLGVFQDHMKHVDLHPMGYHHCHNELRITSSYLPLCVEDKKFVFLSSNFSNGGRLTTATAARFNKLESPYCFNYLEIIVSILKITGGQHIHIGKLSPLFLIFLRLEMRKRGVPSDRFIYIEWVSSVWTTLQEWKIDLYLTSFPYGGGLTLVEAMGAGIPVVIHKHRFSPVISAVELAYPQAFSWEHPNELYSYISELKPSALEFEKKLSRLQYEKFHNPKLLFNYFNNLDCLDLSAFLPPVSRNLKSNYEEWSKWLGDQSALFLFFHVNVYRMLRKYRSLLYGIRNLFFNKMG